MSRVVKRLPDLAKDLRLFAKYHLQRRSVTYPAPETELGHHRLDYDPERYAATLCAFSPRCTVEEVGAMVYRGRTHAAHLVRTPDAPRRVLVLAGVHGNEHAGILAVPDALHRALADEALCSRVQLCVLSPVNPVGAAENSRYNADGYDINRDFVRFYTDEAKMVERWVGRLRPDFILSLHEGPQDATFLFANRLVSRELALAVLDQLQAAGTVLAGEDYFGRSLPVAGYAPMTPVMWRISEVWARTLAMMTSGVYADQRGIPEITLETPWQSADRDARVVAHVEAIDAVMRQVAHMGR